MHRFFLDEPLGTDTLRLQDQYILHQLTKVLRIRKDQSIIFFDGQHEIDYVYRVVQIEKKQILFALQELQEKKNIFLDMHLFQAFPNKISTIEEIVFFGTQIGYASFSFFASEHSQGLFLSDAKKERLEKIITESAEQSGRNTIPPIYFLKHIPQPTGKNICFHPQCAYDLDTLEYIPNETLNIYIGPEWGWSQQEVRFFEQNGFYTIKLHGNILRIVTAVTGIGFYFSQKK